MKLGKKIEQEAQDLMKAYDYPELIVNKKGEFFTNMGLALMSVENKKANLIILKKEAQTIVIDKDAIEAKLKKANTAFEKCTNKLKEFDAFDPEGKTEEVINNNKTAKQKLEGRVKVLEGDIEKLSNELKSE